MGSTSKSNVPMAIRTMPFPIKNSPELSEKIGYLACQQRRAYNMSVEWLNREPDLALRVNANEGVSHAKSLCGRITDLWRSDPSWTKTAPRWIHDAGAKLAYLANERLKADRERRLHDIKAIEVKLADYDISPPSTDYKREQLDKMNRRMERLTRPRRRTLKHRSRKDGTQTLEVDRNDRFRVAHDRMSIEVDHRSFGFVIPLRRPLPEDGEVRSFRLVEKRKNRRGVKNRPLKSIEYEIHVAIAFPAVPERGVEGADLEDIVGVDVGVKKNWWASTGDSFHNDGPHAQDKMYSRPRQMQMRIARKPKRSKRRAKIERRRRELLRKRTEDRKRVFHGHARSLLDKPGIRAVAVEGLSIRQMTASAKGGAKFPGKGETRKRRLNRSMGEAALSATLTILGEQAAKRGIPVLPVPPQGTSHTCSNYGCGYRARSNRKSQSEFLCSECGFSCNADFNASVIIRNRAFVRHVSPDAYGRTLQQGGRNSHPGGGRFVCFLMKAPSTRRAAVRGWRHPGYGVRGLILRIPTAGVGAQTRACQGCLDRDYHNQWGGPKRAWEFPTEQRYAVHPNGRPQASVGVPARLMRFLMYSPAAPSERGSSLSRVTVNTKLRGGPKRAWEFLISCDGQHKAPRRPQASVGVPVRVGARASPGGRPQASVGVPGPCAVCGTRIAAAPSERGSSPSGSPWPVSPEAAPSERGSSPHPCGALRQPAAAPSERGSSRLLWTTTLTID